MTKIIIALLFSIPFVSFAHNGTSNESIQQLKKMCDQKESDELRKQCYSYYEGRQNKADRMAELIRKKAHL
ncbi:TPA: hypothetical protein ACG3OA_002951 [Legionella pneumophila]|uniref:hypothetical protein n=1 Tax=Legionella pneumophila TaxID=446 RepID=UPI000D0674BB|nr:hypothetical protein [Legionella pneumophila]MCH9115412.1 hypothetical protein [Legionella pneumophila serogroup 1]HAT1821672.1 hypothetical protein [Legionella pneumophila]HAU1134375.1 hypothetical protein [Legionella pneumophila]HAU1180823.1 hypothetical protein [Legionella pneumophila]HAU1598981.1 hypothetical protein [Legionella pneumophila]